MSRTTRFAAFVLFYNLATIAWGAVVRASGSGAGCGKHWPRCNGEAIPSLAHAATKIEFAHRLTSGGAFLLVVALAIVAFRSTVKGAPLRRYAGVALALMASEALIGAGLVLLGLVARDASLRRGVAIMLHLGNTFLLLAALALIVRATSGTGGMRVQGRGIVPWLLAIGLMGLMVLGMSGAIAALGDTLFPARTLVEGFAMDASPTAHLFLRLRVYHPVFAAGVGCFVLLTASVVPLIQPRDEVQRWSRVVKWMFLLQFAVGLLNLKLLAPMWLQLIHLLLADALWIAFVLLGASALEGAYAPLSSSRAASPARSANASG